MFNTRTPKYVIASDPKNSTTACDLDDNSSLRNTEDNQKAAPAKALLLTLDELTPHNKTRTRKQKDC